MGSCTFKDASNLKNPLNTYSKVMGQTINWEKILVFLFNTSEDKQIRLARILGYQIGKTLVIYLGLPLG